MTAATLPRPATSKATTFSAQEALRILEQAWAYFTPEPRPAAEQEEPRDRHDAMQLFAYYRPGL